MKWTKLSFEDRQLIERIITASLSYSEAWIDFFCGFGGVTEGITRTQSREKNAAIVIACLNHDENAIGSHKLHNPFCYHITEDIRVAYTDILKYMVREIRRKSNGRVKIKLWFSHECTHYSIAKGGDSRDADSRSLPEELHRYIDDLDPDAVWIENVREFLTWGPLMQKTDEFGFLVWRDEDKTEPWMVPDPDRKGEYYISWRDSIIAKGFKYEYRFLNCADYGCPTIRKRVFIQFLRSEKIVWAPPTHAKDGANGLKPWIPIKDCLDRTDLGTSIFAVKPSGKPRISSRKTFKRLYEGCIKILQPEFEKNGKEPQMVTVYYGNGMNNSVNVPANTLTTKDRISLVSTEQFITQYYSGEDKNRSVNEPSPSITTIPHEKVVTPQFISRYYGNDVGQNQSVENPSGAISTVPKERLVSADPFIMQTNFDNGPKSIDEPSPPILACRKWLYLINMQFNNTGHSVENPSPTLVAKMDKKPNYLVTAEDGRVFIPVYADDFPEVIQIKEFMAKWGICDIYMRELRIPEMLRIHTMPDNLPMVGTITERKKFIGNQVPAQIVTELILGSYYGNQNN